MATELAGDSSVTPGCSIAEGWSGQLGRSGGFQVSEPVEAVEDEVQPEAHAIALGRIELEGDVEKQN